MHHEYVELEEKNPYRREDKSEAERIILRAKQKEDYIHQAENKEEAIKVVIDKASLITGLVNNYSKYINLKSDFYQQLAAKLQPQLSATLNFYKTLCMQKVYYEIINPALWDEVEGIAKDRSIQPWVVAELVYLVLKNEFSPPKEMIPLLAKFQKPICDHICGLPDPEEAMTALNNVLNPESSLAAIMLYSRCNFFLCCKPSNGHLIERIKNGISARRVYKLF